MAADVGGGEDSGKGKKKGRGKKGTPRVDMTPMVDLGFLLLTFFILTATMDDPKSMPIVVPADKEANDPPQDPVAESKVMNIIVSGEDRIYHYMGKTRGEGDGGGMELQQVSYGKGIRDNVLKNKERLKKSRFATKDDPDPMIVMIKIAKDARYANMVDIIDEMNITRQTKYMLIDLSKQEAEIVADYEKGEGMAKSSVTKTLTE
ncbi:MAG: biopolymer transporter ExbD [Bacteroidetes bacterium]|nr:biopolymer transporter ExbD [Bacteroidota bacterium]